MNYQSRIFLKYYTLNVKNKIFENIIVQEAKPMENYLNLSGE